MNRDYKSFFACWMIALVMSWVIAPAATVTWDNDNADGLWSSATNWSGDAVPTNADDVIFNATSTDTCTIDINAAWLSLRTTADYASQLKFGTTIDTSKGSFIINSATTLSAGTSTIIFNGTGNDTLTLGGDTLYDVLVNKSAGTWRNGDKTWLAGDFDCDDGALVFAYTIEYAGDNLIDCDDAVTISDSVIGTGASGTLHFWSTISSLTATGATLYFDATGMTLDDDKGGAYKQIVLNGDDRKLNISGDATNLILSNTDATISTGNSDTLMVSNHTNFICDLNATGKNIMNCGTGFVINSTSNFSFRIIGGDYTATIPAHTFTGTAYETIKGHSANSYTINFGGNVTNTSSNPLVLATTFAGSTVKFNLGNYTIAANDFRTGSGNATGTVKVAYNTATLNLGAYSHTDYNLGTSIDSFQTANITVSTITIGSNHTAVPGSSKWTINNTSTITSANKQFANKLTINASGKTVTGADRIKADSVVVTAGLLTTGGTGTDTVSEHLHLNGGNLAAGNPIYAGYFDIDDGYFYQAGNAVNCTDFAWSSNDSLAIDADLNVSGDFTFDGSATNWNITGDINQTGTADFLWDISTGSNGIKGKLRQGYAGQTVTWVKPGATNRYIIFRNGGCWRIDDETGDIDGYVLYYTIPVDGDTIWNEHLTELSIDSGEVEIHATTAGDIYVGGINAPNLEMNFRPYQSSDTVRYYYLGDVTAAKINCNTQYSKVGEHYFNDANITTTSGNFGVSTNSSSLHTVAIFTTGNVTSAANLAFADKVDFTSGTGIFTAGGNLGIGDGTNTLGAATWVLNGTGAQSITVDNAADTLDSLFINKSGGAASTASNINTRALCLNAGEFDVSADTVSVSGNLFKPGDIDWSYDAASLLSFSADGARIALSPGDTLPKMLVRRCSIDSGGTAQSLWTNADGVKLTMQAGKRFNTIDTMSMGGISGSRDSLISSSAGVRDSIGFGGKAITWQHMYIKDLCLPDNSDTLYANDSTSISGGGNKCQ